MLNKSEQEIQSLDFLPISDILSVIKSVFDRTAVKLHPKILRKLKSYTNSTKRKQ